MNDKKDISFDFFSEDYITIDGKEKELCELENYSIVGGYDFDDHCLTLYGFSDTNASIVSRYSFKLTPNLLVPYDEKYKYGIVDRTGREIQKLKYDYMWRNNNNNFFIAHIGDDKYVITPDGKNVKKIPYDTICFAKYENLFIVSLNGKYGIVDLDLNEVIPLIHDMEPKYIGDGYLFGRDFYDENFKLTKVPEEIDNIIQFDKEYNVAVVTSREKKGIAITVDGCFRFIAQPKYDELIIDDLSDDHPIRFQLGKKTGFIDLNENVILETEYKYVSEFNGDYAHFESENGLCGIINRNGEIIRTIQCNYIWDSSDINNIIVGIDSDWYRVDPDGNFKIISDNSNFKNSKNLSPVKINDKYGYVNQNNEIVIPVQYEYASEFNGNIAWVVDGTIPIDSSFDSGQQINIGHQLFFIDETGKKIIGEKKVLYNNELYPLKKRYIVKVLYKGKSFRIFVYSLESLLTVINHYHNINDYSELHTGLGDSLLLQFRYDTEYLDACDEAYVEEEKIKAKRNNKKVD